MQTAIDVVVKQSQILVELPSAISQKRISLSILRPVSINFDEEADQGREYQP